MELGRRPDGVTLVACCAAGCGTDMGSALASGGAAVVAAGAIGRRCQHAVVGLGANPNRGRFMTTLASR